ncbi:MAG TPA: hypothetical protein DCY20_00040 [Firmicutes bacterium]|nr:hypothetical protein [Bacillota bacterium]
MKLVIFIIMTLQLLLSSFLITDQQKVEKHNELLYSNNTQLSLDFEAVSSNFDITKLFQDLAKKYSVTIFKSTYKNNNSLELITTDTTMDGKIELTNGNYPKSSTDEFISTTISQHSNQVGVIKNFDKDMTINIYNFTHIKNYNPSGIYYLTTNNSHHIDQILDELNSLNVEATILNSFSSTANSLLFLINPTQFCILLCGIFAIIHFIQKELKNIFIYKVYGYKKISIIHRILVQLVKPLISSLVISSALFIILHFTLNATDYFIDSFSLLLKFYLFIFTIYIITAILLGVSYVNSSKYNTVIKGEKPFNNELLGFNILIKVIYTIMILILFVQVDSTSSYLKNLRESLKYWEKTENIYQPIITYTGVEGVGKAAELELYQKGSDFLTLLLENSKAFVLDTNLFSTSSNGTFQYENNISNGVSIDVSVYGKRITASREYFNINTILTSNGESVFNILELTPNTMTILVPEKFKYLEAKINAHYLDYFYSTKVEVENIYRNRLNQPPFNFSKTDLNINLIYVQNNQSYFTFNPYTDLLDQNTIIDPITIIYDEANYHISDIYAYLTSCVFFYSEQINPYEELVPYISSSKLNSLNKIESVYDFLGLKIADLKQQEQQLLTSSLLLIVGNIIITYHFISNYYEKYKKKLYLQRIYGYSWIKKNQLLLILLLSINLTSCFICGIWYNLLPFSILFILLIDIGLFLSLSFVLNKKSYLEIMKGDNL